MIQKTIVCLCTACWALGSSAQAPYHESQRPRIHFSPKAHWMNDPNGMVYDHGVYHLFFQYYPKGTVWGPMHWGHAVSRDLVHWEELPIALYPDSLGYIFSGSAVVKGDTLVAVFTQHDPIGASAHRKDFQNESIAYSLDRGRTWTKFAGNPVLRNPGLADFRDPKVMWYGLRKSWIMTLATGDRVTFYSSPDLIHWTRQSDFGQDLGAHGGVWECPDLFRMNDTWVLIVNINPGGPNGGSATQYFEGDFDGTRFTARDTLTRWLDYGPDEYAGVTWSNTGDRRIFLGWMSNWLYAQAVPTSPWRSAMTVPRTLALKDGRVVSMPVRELNALADTAPGLPFLPCRLDARLNGRRDDSIVFSNPAGERLVVGYDRASNSFYVDRSHAGHSEFYPGFAARYTAPRFGTGAAIPLTLIVDVASLEMFADDGLTVMTATFFPTLPYDRATGAAFSRTAYRSIWP